MKTFIFVVIVIGVFVTYKRNAGKAIAPTASIAAQGYSPGGKVVVVAYTDEFDLLRKLKNIKAGQELELRDVGNHAPVATDISCSDTEAKAKFEEKMKTQAAQINKELRAEFDRINQIR